MNVISRKTLRIFYQTYTDAQDSLEAWFLEASHARWTTPNDIKTRYPSASFVGNDRVVFNIKGNTYRLIVAVKYANNTSNGTVFVRFVGTHAQYNSVNAGTI